MKENGTLTSIFYNFIKAILFILLSYAVINILIVKDNIEANFNYKMIIVSAIIYMLIIIFTMKFNKKSNNNCKKIKIPLYCIFFIVQIVYAILICRSIGFDSGVVYGSAVELVENRFSNSLYFSVYNNNTTLLLILELIFRIVSAFGYKNYFIISVLFNVILVDIAIIYISKICSKMFGNKYSYVYNFFAIPMLAITPYIAVVYTDTISLLFPLAIFYNYLCIKESKEGRFKKVALITAFSVIGTLIKPTCIIILIAIAMIEIINKLSNISFNNIRKLRKNSFSINKEKIKIFIKYILVIITVSIVIFGTFTMYKKIRLSKYITSEEIENNSFPLTHFIMMGLKPADFEGKYYGCYLEEDVQATISHIGTDAKKEYNINEIKNRLKAMGFKGYLAYLYDKYTWIISDGTFFYGREGNFYTSEPYINNGFANMIQNYVYRDREGYQTISINMMQALWTIVLLMVIVDMIINLRRVENSNINVLRLSIIGIILFILLFEARSRYLFNYIPIFIILAVSGIINLYKLVNKENVDLLQENNK